MGACILKQNFFQQTVFPSREAFVGLGLHSGVPPPPRGCKPAFPRPLQPCFSPHSPLTSSPTFSRIVNDILDLAKLQHNKIQLENTEFDLRSCIESALATAAAIPKAAELQLGYLMPCDLTIQGDSNRLQQILLNLLSNAIKFTDEGLVTLTCQVMKMGDSMQVQFMVEDTGTGISWEDCKHLLKDFGQVGSSIAQRQCGTGLGLVISQHLLKAMGSKMEIESTPGQGSKFFFALQCQGKMQLPPMVTKEKKALIVHRCPQQIRRVEAHCESLGMKVCHDPTECGVTHLVIPFRWHETDCVPSALRQLLEAWGFRALGHALCHCHCGAFTGQVPLSAACHPPSAPVIHSSCSRS